MQQHFIVALPLQIAAPDALGLGAELPALENLAAGFADRLRVRLALRGAAEGNDRGATAETGEYEPLPRLVYHRRVSTDGGLDGFPEGI
jgi:hypothetical protein